MTNALVAIKKPLSEDENIRNAAIISQLFTNDEFNNYKNYKFKELLDLKMDRDSEHNPDFEKAIAKQADALRIDPIKIFMKKEGYQGKLVDALAEQGIALQEELLKNTEDSIAFRKKLHTLFAAFLYIDARKEDNNIIHRSTLLDDGIKAYSTVLSDGQINSHNGTINDFINKITSNPSLLQVKAPGDGDCFYHSVMLGIIHDALTGKIKDNSPLTQQIKTKLLPKIAAKLLEKGGQQLDFTNKPLQATMLDLLQKAPLTELNKTLNPELQQSLASLYQGNDETILAIVNCDLYHLLRDVCTPAMRQVMIEGARENRSTSERDVKEALSRTFLLYIKKTFDLSPDVSTKEAVDLEYAGGEFYGITDAKKERMLNDWQNVYMDFFNQKMGSLTSTTDDDLQNLFEDWWNKNKNAAYSTYMDFHNTQNVMAGVPQQTALSQALQCNFAGVTAQTGRISPMLGCLQNSDDTLLFKFNAQHFDAMLGDPPLDTIAPIAQALQKRMASFNEQAHLLKDIHYPWGKTVSAASAAKAHAAAAPTIATATTSPAKKSMTEAQLEPSRPLEYPIAGTVVLSIADNTTSIPYSQLETKTWGPNGLVDYTMLMRLQQSSSHADGISIGITEEQGERYAQEDNTTVCRMPDFFELSTAQQDELLFNAHAATERLIDAIEDEKFQKCGSTAISCVCSTKKAGGTTQINVVAANLADSVAFLVKRNKKTGEITYAARINSELHKPTDKAEKDRIKAINTKAEGEYAIKDFSFVLGERVNARLAVARAFGDNRFNHIENRTTGSVTRNAYDVISHAPAISRAQIELTESIDEEALIIVACDGLMTTRTEALGNSGATDANAEDTKHLCALLAGIPTNCPVNELSKILIKRAIEDHGSNDNVSAIVCRITHDMPELEPIMLGVYDGHGGHDISHFVARELPAQMQHHLFLALSKPLAVQPSLVAAASPVVAAAVDSSLTAPSSNLTARADLIARLTVSADNINQQLNQLADSSNVDLVTRLRSINNQILQDLTMKVLSDADLQNYDQQLNTISAEIITTSAAKPAKVTGEKNDLDELLAKLQQNNTNTSAASETAPQQEVIDKDAEDSLDTLLNQFKQEEDVRALAANSAAPEQLVDADENDPLLPTDVLLRGILDDVNSEYSMLDEFDAMLDEITEERIAEKLFPTVQAQMAQIITIHGRILEKKDTVEDLINNSTDNLQQLYPLLSKKINDAANETTRLIQSLKINGIQDNAPAVERQLTIMSNCENEFNQLAKNAAEDFRVKLMDKTPALEDELKKLKAKAKNDEALTRSMLNTKIATRIRQLTDSLNIPFNDDQSNLPTDLKAYIIQLNAHQRAIILLRTEIQDLLTPPSVEQKPNTFSANSADTELLPDNIASIKFLITANNRADRISNYIDTRLLVMREMIAICEKSHSKSNKSHTALYRRLSREYTTWAGKVQENKKDIALALQQLRSGRTIKGEKIYKLCSIVEKGQRLQTDIDAAQTKLLEDIAMLLAAHKQANENLYFKLQYELTDDEKAHPTRNYIREKEALERGRQLTESTIGTIIKRLENKDAEVNPRVEPASIEAWRSGLLGIIQGHIKLEKEFTARVLKRMPPDPNLVAADMNTEATQRNLVKRVRGALNRIIFSKKQGQQTTVIDTDAPTEALLPVKPESAAAAQAKAKSVGMALGAAAAAAVAAKSTNTDAFDALTDLEQLQTEIASAQPHTTLSDASPSAATTVTSTTSIESKLRDSTAAAVPYNSSTLTGDKIVSDERHKARLIAPREAQMSDLSDKDYRHICTELTNSYAKRTEYFHNVVDTAYKAHATLNPSEIQKNQTAVADMQVQLHRFLKRIDNEINQLNVNPSLFINRDMQRLEDMQDNAIEQLNVLEETSKKLSIVKSKKQVLYYSSANEPATVIHPATIVVAPATTLAATTEAAVQAEVQRRLGSAAIAPGSLDIGAKQVKASEAFSYRCTSHHIAVPSVDQTNPLPVPMVTVEHIDKANAIHRADFYFRDPRTPDGANDMIRLANAPNESSYFTSIPHAEVMKWAMTQINNFQEHNPDPSTIRIRTHGMPDNFIRALAICAKYNNIEVGWSAGTPDSLKKVTSSQLKMLGNKLEPAKKSRAPATTLVPDMLFTHQQALSGKTKKKLEEKTRLPSTPKPKPGRGRS